MQKDIKKQKIACGALRMTKVYQNHQYWNIIKKIHSRKSKKHWWPLQPVKKNRWNSTTTFYLQKKAGCMIAWWRREWTIWEKLLWTCSELIDWSFWLCKIHPPVTLTNHRLVFHAYLTKSKTAIENMFDPIEKYFWSIWVEKNHQLFCMLNS